ncbi:hypothetical protein COMNV_01640 [Commensalibacter sp. Nvir]|uniref:hypothetical protein n=1 Tax=Commensalibacter sp. Nvir TaxID=3069817 RepID=UPI002D713FF4|nr:hypothetical protein COMNV_01640 [Commensalibacter sp. Nvir]
MMCKPEKEITQANLIDVGEVPENGLRLWSARLVYENALKEHERLDTALQRLKTRASNLLGWTMTSMSILISAFSLQGRYHFFLLLMLPSLLLTSFLCVRVLQSTVFYGYTVSDTKMDELQNTLGSELEIIEHLTLDINELNDTNAVALKNVRNYMQWSWIAFLSTPTLGLILLIFGSFYKQIDNIWVSRFSRSNDLDTKLDKGLEENSIPLQGRP